jgi:riboflavin kinase/FMN adenylyltransferase
MRVLRGHRQISPPLRTPSVTIGNFDGVHLGHQALFARVRERAQALGGEAVVFTFRPHPVKVLAPELAPPLITPYEEKLRLIEGCGMDAVVEETFDLDLAALSPRAFVEQVLSGAVGAKDVVVGYDFTFGRDRAGNVELLRALGAELAFTVNLEPAVTVGGLVASSTKVREFLLEGRVRGAAIILGRDFSLRGTVVRGDNRGAQIGFPTANLATQHELIPKPGVYACRAALGAERHRAVVNVGYAPTFSQGRELTIEAHLLDFRGDLYGAELTLEFRHRLRDERRFPSVAELVEQIARDVEEAKALL